MNWPSSAIRVVEQTPARLWIVDPPYYLIGAVFLAVGVLCLALTPITGKKACIPLGLVFALIGGAALTGRSDITLSRAENRLVADRSAFGIRWGRQEIPLADIRQAMVVTGDQTVALAVLLRSGNVVQLGNASDRQGYYPAVEAMNRFLK